MNEEQKTRYMSHLEKMTITELDAEVQDVVRQRNELGEILDLITREVFNRASKS